MLQHKPFCKNLLNKGKKKNERICLNKPESTHFFQFKPLLQSYNSVVPPSRWRCTKRPFLKPMFVCLFVFLVLSQASEHPGAIEKALGKYEQSVHAKSIFHISIHAVEPDSIRSYFAVSPSITSQSKLLFGIPWCKLLMLQNEYLHSCPIRDTNIL